MKNTNTYRTFYHFSPRDGLTKLVPSQPRNARRPVGVYIHPSPLNGWLAVLSPLRFFIYEVKVDENEMLLYQRDGASSISYEQVKASDVRPVHETETDFIYDTSESVLLKSVPAEKVGEVFWNGEKWELI